MAGNPKAKLKLLCMLQILQDHTDIECPISTQDLMKRLQDDYNISSERKSIYTDIALLQEFGAHIYMAKEGKNNVYAIGERDFQAPEVQMLIDAVQSSHFITPKKSTELVQKLKTLVGPCEAGALNRSIIVSDQVKMENERIYFNIDTMYKAIKTERQVRFKYFTYSIDKEKLYRRGGAWYYVSPYALTWNNNNYYLIGYYEQYHKVTHFRIDRMTEVEISRKKSVPYGGAESPEPFHLGDYSKKVFHMFSGTPELVSLQFDNSLIHAVIDRFGMDVEIVKSDDQHFTIEVEVVTENSFYSWLFLFGQRVKILSPQHVQEHMHTMARAVLEA